LLSIGSQNVLGGNQCNGHVVHESSQPAGAFLHAGLFTRDVTDHDQRLVAPFGCRVRRIFDGFPLAGLAHHQHLDIVALESLRFCLKTGRSRAESNLGDPHPRIADHPHHR